MTEKTDLERFRKMLEGVVDSSGVPLLVEEMLINEIHHCGWTGVSVKQYRDYTGSGYVFDETGKLVEVW